MTELVFEKKHALEAIRLTNERGLSWLYSNYPKPNGQMRKSSTGFLMHGGESYPVKPLGRLSNEISGHPMTNNPITNVFRRHFQRLGFQLIDTLEDEAVNAVDRQRRLAETWNRPEQAKFRRAVFALFGARCVVTGCETLEALEAAHIQPVSQGGCNEAWNGIPLRADLHRLFDAQVIAFEEGTLRLIVSEPQRKDYGEFHGRDLAALIANTDYGTKIADAVRQRQRMGH